MRPFKFTTATNTSLALKLHQENPTSTFLAGGTNLIDLMKEGVANPDQLIDINKLEWGQIKSITSGSHLGGLSLGALAKNTATANHPLVRQHYPLLSQAILAGASVQLRNMASNGGNLMQRTRCQYFYDIAMPCNKREPGSGCGAMEGFNRMHAVFGWSEKCIAVYPSDMAIALSALDAEVKVQKPDGSTRIIPFADFHRLPGDHPELDNNLKPNELIVSIDLPKNTFAAHSYYLKVRDRASYAFALVSVAAALELNGNKITKARISLGGVAHKPWRAIEAEQFLVGKEANPSYFKEAGELAMKQAKPLEHNKFKVELGKRTIARALQVAFDGKR